MPAGVFELIDGPHQARVPLLDQVQEAHSTVAVVLGDRDDQAEVVGAQLLPGGLVLSLMGNDKG